MLLRTQTEIRKLTSSATNEKDPKGSSLSSTTLTTACEPENPETKILRGDGLAVYFAKDIIKPWQALKAELLALEKDVALIS